MISRDHIVRSRQVAATGVYEIGRIAYAARKVRAFYQPLPVVKRIVAEKEYKFIRIPLVFGIQITRHTFNTLTRGHTIPVDVTKMCIGCYNDSFFFFHFSYTS